jgi:PAS domain S-box-containing protein
MIATPVPELEDLLEPYRIAFEASPIGMSFVSWDWRFVECNPALCKMLGRTEAELRARSATDFTHPDDKELHVRDHERLLAGEIDGYELEARYIHSDGHVGWVSVHVGVLRDATGEPRMVISLVEDITERRWMREVHDRLLGLVLVGQGAPALAAALAGLIESPVALLDGYGQLLAEGEHAGRSVAIPSRDELQSPEPASYDGLTVRPLRLGEHIEGYLLAEDPPGARHLTARAIEQAASTFALQLAMTRNAEEVEHRLHGDLSDAMLSDTPPDSASLVRWGQRLGHDLFAFRLFAFVRPWDAEPSGDSVDPTRLTRAVGSVARELAAGSVAVPRGDAVLAALVADSFAQGRVIADRLVERVARRTGIRVVAGLSRELTGPGDLGTAVRDARQAVDAAVALPRLGPVAAFGDLDLQHLLLGSKAPDDIASAARRTLGPLLEHPARRNREKLIETLAVYLQSVGSLETTARRLGIHINTLRERVRRIEEALQLDLHDARHRVNLQLDVLELLPDLVVAQTPRAQGVVSG